jgi:hypothetical protein
MLVNSSSTARFMANTSGSANRFDRAKSPANWNNGSREVKSRGNDRRMNRLATLKGSILPLAVRLSAFT